MSERLQIQMIDVHTHLRDRDESHKGTIETETKAAIYGGIVAVGDMPNNNPPIDSALELRRKISDAREMANTYYGAYTVGTKDNSGKIYKASQEAFALKLFMNNTHGDLLLEDHEALRKHFEKWCGPGPICVHAEGVSLEAAINFARAFVKPLHVCHVSTKDEILAIAEAKEAGLPITCEVTPHHLLMNEQDATTLGPYGHMKPELKSAQDVAALWHNLEYIDILATDHAPHTKAEKDSQNPPPGIPSIEHGALLMLTAVAEGRLTIEKFIDMTKTKPKKIFKLPKMPETYALIEIGGNWHVGDKPYQTKVGWSPYEGAVLRARVREVYVNGEQVLNDDEFTVPTKREELMIRQ